MEVVILSPISLKPVVQNPKMPDVDILSDMFISVANLVEMESHAQMSYFMTQDKKWLEIKNKISKIRQRQQRELEKEENSQLHCFNKHIFSGIIRSWEVADKYFRNNEKEKSMEFYKESQNLLEIFYQLNFSEEPKGIIDKIKEKIQGGNKDV